MTQTDIRDYINYHTQFYGRGWKYECTLLRDDYKVPNLTKTELIEEAEEGDEVRINVVQGHQGRKRGHIVESIRFKIEKDEEILEKYRDSKGKSIFRKPQDSDRGKVYAWESRSLNYSNHEEFDELENAQEFVNEVFEDFGLEPPTIVFDKSRSKTCSYVSRRNFGEVHEIRIADWGFSKVVLLHESAHAIVGELGIEHLVSSHGPFWFSIYVDLLSEYLEGIDKEEILMEASYFHDLEYIEGVDIEFWKEFKNNDEKVEVKHINYLRQEDYALSDGTKLSDSQKEAISKVHNGEGDKVDGRSGNALVRKDILSKEGNAYKLTERGEEVIENLEAEF